MTHLPEQGRGHEVREGRFCTGCGHEIGEETRFCTGCGRAVAGKRPAAFAAGEPSLALGHDAPVARPAPAWPDPVTTTSASGTDDSLRADAPLRRSSGNSGPGLTPGRPLASPAAPDAGAGGGSRRRSRWPLILVPVLLLAGGGAGAAAYFLHSSHKSGGATGAYQGSQRAVGASSPVSTGASSAGASSPAQSAQQQAAESLAALLAQSVTDRSSVVNAVHDVNSCGPGLSQDSQTFASAATSRQDLLSQLAKLPGRSALPGPMIRALTHAWQASVQADQDFARWAQDEASQGCTQNDHSDPNYQATAGPDSQATVGKKSFAAAWNPIAAQYSLTSYQWNQL
jgi:flagellar basal body-associated protein FliL